MRTAILAAQSNLVEMFMSETMARIGLDGTIELADERSAKIDSVAQMKPLDAAYLARGLLACSASFFDTKPPNVGAIIGDSHFPVIKFAVSVGTETKMSVIVLTIPPGIDLVFQLSPQIEREMGAALVAHANGEELPENQCRSMIQ